MFDPGDAGQRRNELLPPCPLGCEHAASLRGDPVEPSAALASLFYPAALDETAVLETVEQGIQRRDVKFQYTPRPLVDQLGDLVAMPRALFDERQHEQFGAALLEIRPHDVSWCHMYDHYICGCAMSSLHRQPGVRGWDRGLFRQRRQRAFRDLPRVQFYGEPADLHHRISLGALRRFIQVGHAVHDDPATIAINHER